MDEQLNRRSVSHHKLNLSRGIEKNSSWTIGNRYMRHTEKQVETPCDAPKECCVFEYLYRDASNYKAWGGLLLSGIPSQSDVAAFRACLESGAYLSQNKSAFLLYTKSYGICLVGEPATTMLCMSLSRFVQRVKMKKFRCRCLGSYSIYSKPFRQ